MLYITHRDNKHYLAKPIKNKFLDIPTYLIRDWPTLGTCRNYEEYSWQLHFPSYPLIILSTKTYYGKIRDLYLKDAILAHEIGHYFQPNLLYLSDEEEYLLREIDAWRKALVLLYWFQCNMNCINYAKVRIEEFKEEYNQKFPK